MQRCCQQRVQTICACIISAVVLQLLRCVLSIVFDMGDYDRSMWRRIADIVGVNAAHYINDMFCELVLRHVSKSAVHLLSSGKGRHVHKTWRMVATMSQRC